MESHIFLSQSLKVALGGDNGVKAEYTYCRMEWGLLDAYYSVLRRK